MGGIARFAHVLREFQRKWEDQSGGQTPLLLFSGDLLNPSVESAITKGLHMIKGVNALGEYAPYK